VYAYDSAELWWGVHWDVRGGIAAATYG